jgi:glycosyltransferase involved in cell wall biosynthesis
MSTETFSAGKRYVLITPCRDEAAYARRCIDSVLAQTLLPALWVIVGDGSSDATGAIVEEYAQKALDFFSLSKEKLGAGYYYSIAELVSIYLTNTEYLLHFSGDSIVAPWTRKDWLSKGIATLKCKPEVKVFNLTWNRKYKDARRDSKFVDKNNYYGYGFSDQMYLVRTADFKMPIYEYYHSSSENYPTYGGELFEKRVYSWLRSHHYLRATYRYGSYLHENFPQISSSQLLPAFFDCFNPFK